MVNEKKLQQLAKQFLIEIGENPSRPGLKDTPKRMAKMWMEVFRGYDKESLPDVRVFPNNEDGINYDQIVIDQGTFFSHCEHHCAVFYGTYYFGYIPDKQIVGLSKIARLIDFFASRMQVQERIGEQLLSYLDSKLQPKGMILIMKAKHTCKMMRGVKKDGEMTTAIVKGIFATDASAKSEFMSLISMR